MNDCVVIILRRWDDNRAKSRYYVICTHRTPSYNIVSRTKSTIIVSLYVRTITIIYNNQRQQKNQKESDKECVINLYTVLIVRPSTIVNCSTIQHTIQYTQQIVMPYLISYYTHAVSVDRHQQQHHPRENRKM